MPRKPVPSTIDHQSPAVSTRLLAGLELRGRALDARGPEQVQDQLDRDQRVPRVEAPHELTTDVADRAPEHAGQRLEGSFPPGRDRERAAAAHHPPQLARKAHHVVDEEDAEHAHDGVEAAVGFAEGAHVRDAEGDVPQPLAGGFGARSRHQGVRQIDPQHRSLRSHRSRGRQRRRPAAARHVQDRGARPQAQPLDGPRPDARPEPERRIVIVDACAIVARRDRDRVKAGRGERGRRRPAPAPPLGAADDRSRALEGGGAARGRSQSGLECGTPNADRPSTRERDRCRPPGREATTHLSPDQL